MSTIKLKVIYFKSCSIIVTGSIPILEEVREQTILDDVKSVMSTIDEGTYLVLRSASGAFTCRYPPVPKKWNPIDRPHVALLLRDSNRIFPVFLSQPNPDQTSHDLDTIDLSTLPSKSIIEIRHDNSHYAYYRRDNGSWTKVAEANDPFLVEVFSHGYAPIVMNLILP